MGVQITDYFGYTKGVTKQQIFGMCGKGHEKGTKVFYKLVGGIYHYIDPTTQVLVRTVKLCV